MEDAEVAAIVAFVGLAAHAVAFAPVAVRGFREKLPDRWSTLVSTLALAVLAVLTWRWAPALLPAPYLAAVAVWAVAAPVATLVFTLSRMQRLLDALPAALHPKHEASHEERRKLPHLAMGLALVGYAGLGHGLALLFAPLHPDLAAAAELPWVLAGQQAVSAWLLLLLLALLPVEAVRLHWPAAPYPWKRVIESRMRPRERGLVMAHVHMAVGAASATLFLGHEGLVPAAIATLAVSVFADTASALVGTKWGRTKWRHSPGKSHLGTLAGLLVAFLVAFPFVGLPLAVAAALLFTLLDLVAPAWVPVSDNLLNPLGLAALFWAFAFA